MTFGATTLAIGIGHIYLPLHCRLKYLLGELFKEEDMPMQARKEMEKIMMYLILTPIQK